MRTRVVHLASGAEWRGEQRQLHLLAMEQRSRGQEPLVIGPPRSQLVTRLRAAGAASAGIRIRASWDIAAARRARRAIRAWRADVVHVHDQRAATVAAAALVGLSRIALVISERGWLNKPRTAAHPAARVSRIIAPNETVRQSLLQRGFSGEMIDVVQPGTPPVSTLEQRDWRGECGWPADAVVCGVMGVDGSAGRARLRAIAELLAPDARAAVRLVIFGAVASGPFKVAGVTAFGAGFVHQVDRAVAGLDSLWLMSGPESLGAAALDAMSARVPPLAYDTAGFHEFIEHGRSGLLVPLDDTESFATAASALVLDGELRGRLGTFGPGRASHFSVRRTADLTEAVYARAIEARARAAEASALV